MQYPDIPLNTHGRRPLDPTNIVLEVGPSPQQAVVCRNTNEVYVQLCTMSEALEIVHRFNNYDYMAVMRIFKRKSKRITPNGISLWMGMYDEVHSRAAAQPAAAINPTFARSGKQPPKNYKGGHLDPAVIQARVIRRTNKHPVQMWKVTVGNPTKTGARYLLWTDREQLAIDLCNHINSGDLQQCEQFMSFIVQNIPTVGYGQAGTHLKDVFHKLHAIYQHELTNAQGRAASAGMFQTPQHYSPAPDPSDDDSASDENYALDADAPDTWGIGNKPHAKVKQWEPDTPDPDVDLMKSIRDACHR